MDNILCIGGIVDGQKIPNYPKPMYNWIETIDDDPEKDYITYKEHWYRKERLQCKGLLIEFWVSAEISAPKAFELLFERYKKP